MSSNNTRLWFCSSQKCSHIIGVNTPHQAESRQFQSCTKTGSRIHQIEKKTKRNKNHQSFGFTYYTQENAALPQQLQICLCLQSISTENALLEPDGTGVYNNQTQHTQII